MTEYYSLGHKIVAVVLALVLMGFGWPAVNPDSIYAESDSATEQADSSSEKKAEEKKAEEAKEKAEAEKAEKKAAEEAAAKEKAEKEAAAKKAEEEVAAKKAVKEASSSKSSENKTESSASKSSSTKASDSSSSDKSDKEESDEATEYKIALKLNNASIKIKSAKDQTVTAPSTNLTVPAGKDFKFTVEPNEGYEIEKVTLKSSTTRTLEANESDVYTISASSLTTGMKLTLVTEKQESSTTEEDATPIEETEDTEANEEAQDAVANTDNADAGISLASLDGQSTNAVSDTSDYEVKVGDTLSLEGSSGYDHSWKSSSTTNATVKDTSGSSHWSTTGTATVTGVKAGTVTITHTYYTYDWGYKKKNTETFAVTVTSNGNTATFNPTISNADVAYFNWHSSSDTSSISFTSVSSGGTLSISDFNSSSQAGYVVFFVKPNSNYLFTGLGADGNGDTYVVGSGQYGNIAGYPKIDAVMNAAKAAGYVAAFGYSRSANDKAPTNTAFQVKAQSPDMTITATSSKTSDVLAGDTLTFTVVMTPQLTGSGRDKVTDVEVNNVTVNGKSATCSKIIDNGDGTYTTTVEYTVTEADCSRSTVDLKVDATSTYEANLSTSLSKITTTASISKTATASCAIAPKSDVTYEFESGTSDVELPDGIYKLLPKDSKKYQKGVKVPASKTPASGDEYEDADNGGYWAFQGWDANTKTMTEDGITFIGTWTFTQCSKYTIKYVDEDGKEIAESKTSADLKVGDEINTSEIEKPEIKGYTFSSIDPASTLTIDSDESKNVITLTYKTKAGKAGYNLVLNSASWSAPEDTSQLAGSQKWYYNYGFAKGDTFQVTSSEPSAENHAFIGWMDKERDGQAAAIRSAGESVTYCYSKNQTYTLDALWASLSATGGEYVYDGTSRTISVDVNINEGTGLDPKYAEQAKKLITTGDTLYSTDGGKTWSKDKPSFTNAGEYTVKVKQDVTVGGKTTTLTAEATVVIAKRSVVFTGNSDTKTYNGSEQTVTGYTTNDGEGAGLVSGQTTNVEANASGLLPGTYPGTITAAKDVAIKAGDEDVTANYNITTEPGTLTIDAVEGTVTVTAASDSKTYDGTALTNGSFTYTDGVLVEGDVLTAVVEGSATNVGDEGKNTVTSYKVMHGDTDVTSAYTFAQSVDGKLTINKKAASITAGSAEKEYDGTALTTNEFSTDGFIKGQGIASATIEGSQTLVGTSASTVKDNSWTAKDGTNLNNYDITTNNGSLTVKDRESKYAVNVVANSAEFTYDGAEHKATGLTGTTFTNDKGVTFTVAELSAEDAVATDAGEYAHEIKGTAKVVDLDGNDVTAQFTVNTQDGKLVINQKAATITAGSAEKEYDGTALTTNEFSTDGFIEGQGIASATIEGSQTVVGSSPSTVADNSWTALDGTNLNNYTITTQPGTLTVTNRSAKYQIEVEANSGEYKYDGTEKFVSGLKTTTFTVDGHKYTVSGLAASGAKGTDAGTYYNTVSGTAVVKDAAGNDVTAQFAVSVKDGQLKITEREVTITSKDAKKVYDGQPLTKHEVEVSGDGIAEADEAGVGYNFTGTQTEVGTSDNAFTVSGLSSTNYKVTTEYGTLKVTPVTDKVTVTITEHGGSYTYDGTEKSATGYDVSSSNELYTSSCFSFSGKAEVAGTDAGTYEMKLKASDFENTSKNFSNVEFKIVDATLAIAKRNVTLTSATDSKVYDGTALTNGNVDVSGDGFVEGEGASYDVTGSITNAGSVDNEFSYTLNKGTKAGNYNIKSETGTLTVSPVTDEVVVTVVGKTGGEKYNGEKQTVTGYSISANNTLYKVDDAVSFSGKASVSATDADTYQMGLAADQFSNTDDNFTKVRFVVTDGQLVIAKRQVTLTSGSKEKEYDGKPLTNGEVSVSGDGFVDGQGATYKVTGSQTVPGSSENLFTYKLNSGTNEQNYEIEVKYGTLNVTNREAQYEITVEANSGTATYDGQQHSAVGLKTTSFVVDGETYTVSGLSTEDPAQTDAGTYTNNIIGTPVVTDANENDVTDQFKVSMQNGSLTINKRGVVLQSESASKVYDGTPLTKPDVTTSGEGFVDGEVSDVTATGTVTDVSQGKVTNTITYTAGEKFNENNYSITKNEGKLWITSQNIDPGTDPDNPNPDYGGVEINSPNNETYDGNEHKWAPEVKDAQGNALKEGVDYEVSYDTDNFTDVTGAITVTITGKGNYTGTVTRTYQITPRPYKVSTSTAYKTYDGKPLTAGGKIEGIVDGEDAGFVVTGSQTKVGSSDNTYEIKWNSNAKKSNYKLDEENVGKLTVGEYSGQIIVTTTGGTFTYDGQAHGADVSVSTLPKGYTLETASSNATATNVDDGEVKATADTLVIRNASGDDVTSNLNIRHIDGTIKITPATLTVTTPDASKVYDGSALKAEGGYSGLMDGETVNFVTTGSQTDKGSSTNTYELQWTGSAKESNYTVSESLGTLTVTEQSITPGTDPENPDPSYAGVQIDDPKGKTYDGVALKWIPEVKDAAGNALTEGTDYTVVYKRDGKETADFTNVGTIEVTITGEGNYKGTVTKSYKITKAPLEVSTPDATKVYDGTPLTAAATSDNISGLVAGETAAVKATGSQTKVGSSENTYSGIEWGTAKESNYYVKSTTVGELKVTEQSITPGTDPENPDPSYAGVQIDDPKGKTYDGVALKWIPEVKDAAGNALTEGTDYTVVYKRDGKETADFTNVGTIEVTITGIGNYKGTVTKSYQITKRPVTLTSESYTFTYNGKAQGWNKFTCSDKLFESQVDDLGCMVTVKQAGEQKENTVSYTFKSGFSADNYQITNNFGTLYVKNSEDEIVVTTTGGTFTYDGQAHGATVSVSALPDGYTLETASSSATATNVDDGEVAATADTLVIFNAEDEDVTASLNIKKIDDTIQITPAAYSVTTGSATKVYDGTALLGSEAKGNEVGGLVNDADATFTVTGSQTEVGGSEGNNTYTLEFASEQMAKNYKLDGESLGTLTVTGQSIDPNDPDAYKGVEIDSPEDKTYDGNEHKWAPEVKDAAGNTLTEGTDYEVSYSTDNFTDVTGTITVTITGKGNYTGSVTREYQITPAAYSVTTGSATKVYDGTALLGSEAKGNEVGGLVNDADATFTVTGSQTEVGGSEGNNTYTLEFASEQMAKNYKLDGESLGTLTVTGQSIDPNDPDAYKGVEIDSPEDKTYDGNEHKWAPEVKDAAGNTLTEGTDYEVSYSTDNFTDVTGTITVTITGKGNYTGSVTREYQITPKGITVESASNQWVYDGEEHSDASATITGLVNKADATAKGAGKITKVGSVENTIELKFASKQMEKNYNVTEWKPGTLTVTENADEVVVTTTGGTFTYDGQAHGATVSVSALPEGYTLEAASSSATAANVADGEVTATADTLVIRNASGEDVTSKLKITYVDGTIKIVPAELRITTGSATKAYDGTALTNGDLKITGLVGDDAVVAKTNGSQTEVGSSANTYLIDWGTVDANNYSIVESLGTLTVTKAAVTPNNNGGNGDNDGNGGTARTTTAATPAAAAAAAAQNVANVVAGNPEGETIYDAENPLGTAEAECWVHYYMILCMILTALYGIGVWAHRANYTRKLRKDMDDVMNDGDGINPEKGELAGTSTVANQA